MTSRTCSPRSPRETGNEKQRFRNGNTAVCGEDGKQITRLQSSWLLKYVEFLEAGGLDVLDTEFHLPDGYSRAKLFRCKDPDTNAEWYNWEVLPK